MDQFLNWLTRWVERGVVNTFGPVTDQAVAGPIKISDVLCVLIYLALAFIIDRVIAWIVLRRARAHWPLNQARSYLTGYSRRSPNH